ncbi:hypothetical protein JKP88DRAFT_277504 [Tribonema minus]|uniref:Uncharacterized protein n=1 Tax=Tribonema minus TaxID=303371 RepID=A0A836CFM4_9STRA|nr:hypothetical protein JKP88DRAFT_277504 [Tribonema minus]
MQPRRRTNEYSNGQRGLRDVADGEDYDSRQRPQKHQNYQVDSYRGYQGSQSPDRSGYQRDSDDGADDYPEQHIPGLPLRQSPPSGAATHRARESVRTPASVAPSSIGGGSGGFTARASPFMGALQEMTGPPPDVRRAQAAKNAQYRALLQADIDARARERDATQRDRDREKARELEEVQAAERARRGSGGGGGYNKTAAERARRTSGGGGGYNKTATERVQRGGGGGGDSKTAAERARRAGGSGGGGGGGHKKTVRVQMHKGLVESADMPMVTPRYSEEGGEDERRRRRSGSSSGGNGHADHQGGSGGRAPRRPAEPLLPPPLRAHNGGGAPHHTSGTGADDYRDGDARRQLEGGSGRHRDEYRQERPAADRTARGDGGFGGQRDRSPRGYGGSRGDGDGGGGSGRSGGAADSVPREQFDEISDLCRELLREQKEMRRRLEEQEELVSRLKSQAGSGGSAAPAPVAPRRRGHSLSAAANRTRGAAASAASRRADAVSSAPAAATRAPVKPAGFGFGSSQRREVAEVPKKATAAAAAAKAHNGRRHSEPQVPVVSRGAMAGIQSLLARRGDAPRVALHSAEGSDAGGWQGGGGGGGRRR